MMSLSTFRNHFYPVFTLLTDLHLNDSCVRSELTGSRLGVEFKFEKITDEPNHLILLGERRLVILIDRNSEMIKNSTVYNGWKFWNKQTLFCTSSTIIQISRLFL